MTPHIKEPMRAALGKRQVRAWYARYGFRPSGEELFMRKPKTATEGERMTKIEIRINRLREQGKSPVSYVYSCQGQYREEGRRLLTAAEQRQLADMEAVAEKKRGAKKDPITYANAKDRPSAADYRRLKVTGGKDRYSRMSSEELRSLVDPAAAVEIAKLPPELQAAAMRWYLRGLRLPHAIGKVRHDQRLARAARRRAGNDYDEFGYDVIDELKAELRGFKSAEHMRAVYREMWGEALAACEVRQVQSPRE